jgi:uncharacterized membrane protein YphA (DoxX/SURF4 family)
VGSRIILIVCAVLAVALAAAEPGSAHPAGATVAPPMSASNTESRSVPFPLETSPKDVDATTTRVLVLVLILGGLCLAVGRQHAARVVAFTLLLIFSGFEGALHSVHHLDDTTAQCRVASSAEHVSVIAVDAPGIRVPSIVAIEGPGLERHAPVRPAPLTPASVRAPPA